MKVAIYSGVVPSTTFIETLIRAVQNESTTVYLFGSNVGDYSYSKMNVKIFHVPENKLSLLIYASINKLRLFLKSRKEFSLLKKKVYDSAVDRKHRWVLWAKYLPVILNKPDVFHLQWARAVEEWIFLKTDFNIKFVLSLRGTHVKYSPLTIPGLADSYRKYFPIIDRFHAVSKNIAKAAETYGASENKTNVIYTGIEKALLPDLQKSTKLKSSKLRILSVGRLVWIKGYHFAIDTLKRMHVQGFDFEYTIIGSGKSDEIPYMTENSGIKEKFRLIGKVDHKTVLNIMQDSDLLLIPSFDEGIANVAIEAMAAGLPVLSSNCGGMNEVVIHGETGYLFEPRNYDDLISKIKMIAEEKPEVTGTITMKAANMVEKNFQSDRLGDEMLQLYSGVLNEK